MTPVEQIKQRLSVTDVVSGYLKLTKAGSNFKAVCPFHSEKSPSFFVSPARDVWHCFGCGKGGDQFRFVQEIEGVEFREALRLLAERAGVELRSESPHQRDERARLFAAVELAAKFYEAALTRVPAVCVYLQQRGVRPETIAQFRIGYAPPEASGWRVFTEYALKKGYTEQELEKTGMLVKSQNTGLGARGSGYDRFRNRIMFPIADANGRVVAFGGRIFGEHDAAKYINSPQTALYDKSRILYAFDKAKVPIRKVNTCIVVEGYMDAVMAHQAGTEHVVAVSGTALTLPQLTMLRRLSDKLITSFDMDEAGETATRRSLDLALSMGFDVHALALPFGKDPADLAMQNAETWRETTENAIDIIMYFLNKAEARADAHTLEGKRSISRSVLSLVARLPREVEKAHWVSVIAARLGVREEAVWEDIKQAGRTAEAPQRMNSIPAALPQKTRRHILEERIIGLLYTYGIPQPAVCGEALFVNEDLRALYRLRAPAADTRLPEEEHLRALASRLVFETEMLVPKDDAVRECEVCVSELRREDIKEKLEQLTFDIRRAEEAGNAQQVSKLADEFQTTSQLLN
jgi:DNA primase